MANEQMKKNGNIWKIAGIGITVLGLVVGIIYGYATLENQVSNNAKMQPKVDLNTEHRIKFEEKVDNMEKNIRLILEEVKK